MRPPAAADESFRPDINALRALAVGAVILFHFGLAGASSGYVGVDVFFVISGYLIGGQIMARLDRGTFSLKHFFAGRIRRIVPALAATCAVVLAWGWFVQLPTDYDALSRSATNAMDFLSNRYFSRQLGYFDLGAAYKPLLHTWSLSVEAQFYLFLPFVLMAAWKLARPAWRAPLLVALAVLSFAGALRAGHADAAKVFYSFPSRAWEFLVGGLAALVPVASTARLGRAREPLLAIAWALLLATCFLLPGGVVWPGPWTLAPVLLTAAVIVLGAARPTGRIAGHALVQHTGTISYSLYLWHWPILVAWKLTFLTDPAQGWGVLPLLAATWAAAWLSWRFAEQPLRTRAGWSAPRRLYAAYAGVLVAFAGFGHWMSASDGYPPRLPAYVQGAVSAAVLHTDLSGCTHLPGENPREPPYACRLGAPSGDPTFAFWGDSHALQYLPLLREEVPPDAAGMLFHFPGCEPSFDGSVAKSPGCDQHNREVARALAATPSIRTIVIVLRQNDARRVARAWETARTLARRGLRVMFLGPTPEGDDAVAQRWAALQLLERAPIPDMAVPRTHATRVPSYDERLATWRAEAARSPGVLAIDLTPLFCDARQCRLVQDGVGLVRDTDHLTPPAARRVMPLLRPAWTPAAR